MVSRRLFYGQRLGCAAVRPNTEDASRHRVREVDETVVGPRRAACDGGYMGALVATRRHTVIRAFYARLVTAGTPKTVTLIAYMRKLLTIFNAMMRTNTTWQQVSQPENA